MVGNFEQIRQQRNYDRNTAHQNEIKFTRRKRIYFMDALIYREFYEPAPATIEMDIYEMDEAAEIIFHNYLIEKEGLCNTLLRFPHQYIPDGEHYILIYKE
jgi:hypothetical protein